MKAGKPRKTEIKVDRIKQDIKRYEDWERKRLVKAAMDDLEEDITTTLSYHHNIDMIAMMLALRDEFGFGKSRLLRAIRKTVGHSERMLLDNSDIDEMLTILKDETGICEEELVWEDEVEIPVKGIGLGDNKNG